jgi:hypothetical protein
LKLHTLFFESTLPAPPLLLLLLLLLLLCSGSSVLPKAACSHIANMRQSVTSINNATRDSEETNLQFRD